MLRWFKHFLGLDFGDIPRPYPADSPARRALREAVLRGFETKLAEKEKSRSGEPEGGSWPR